MTEENLRKRFTKTKNGKESIYAIVFRTFRIAPQPQASVCCEVAIEDLVSLAQLFYFPIFRKIAARILNWLSAHSSDGA